MRPDIFALVQKTSADIEQWRRYIFKNSVMLFWITGLEVTLGLDVYATDSAYARYMFAIACVLYLFLILIQAKQLCDQVRFRNKLRLLRRQWMLLDACETHNQKAAQLEQIEAIVKKL
jgi:hypothetical protein